MFLALRHWIELNLCSLINGLIGLLTTAVFRDIVAPTIKIAKSWCWGGWLVGWKASGAEGVGTIPGVCMCEKVQGAEALMTSFVPHFF